MKLVPFSKASTVDQQVLVDYVNSVVLVARYAYNVNTTQLPALVFPPDHYSNYVETMTWAKRDAVLWLDAVIPLLTDIPTVFVTSDALIEALLNDLLKCLVSLQKYPADSQTMQEAQLLTQKVSQYLEKCTATIESLLFNIKSYQTDLTPIAAQLETLCGDIKEATQADVASVATLNGMITNFQDQIELRSEIATLEEWESLAFGVFLGGVGLAVCTPFAVGIAVPLIVGGAVCIITTSVTSFVTIDPTIDYAFSTKDIQAEIDAVSQEIGLVNTTVALLENISSTFSAISDQTDDVYKSLWAVQQFWYSPLEEINALSAIMGDLSDQLNSRTISEIMTDFNTFQAQWKTLIDWMKEVPPMKLNIDSLNE